MGATGTVLALVMAVVSTVPVALIFLPYLCTVNQKMTHLVGGDL